MEVWTGRKKKKSKANKPYKKPGVWWHKVAPNGNSNVAASTSAGLGGQVSALMMQCFVSLLALS